MTSAPSNRLAAHPLAQCAHCAEPQCPLTQPAPLSSPRRAGEEGSLHAGLEAEGLDLAAAPSLARAEQRQDVAGLGAPYVPAGDMLGNPMVPMNLQLCPPPSLRLGTGQRMPPLSQGSLPTGWILAAAVKVPLGEKHQASGSGPA